MTTHQQPPAPARRGTRFSPRLCRLLTVLGLCVMVLPVTGFWMGATQADRGIFAVRLRIDHLARHNADTPENLAIPATDPRHAPLTADRTRFRATVRAQSPAPADQYIRAGGVAAAPSGLLQLHGGGVALTLAGGVQVPLKSIATANPSQEYRFWSRNSNFTPIDGVHRQPDFFAIRWLTEADWKMGDECPTRAETSLVADIRTLALRMRLPFDARAPHPKSGQYIDLIRQASGRFALPPQLIYAIMQTESAFNPFAVSNAGALGLMQVVPESAGHEVQAFLTGKAGRPSSSLLFNPESNVEYGTAYLHLLATRYFAGVTNPAARELCMIAGYNAGPRAVLKLFEQAPEAAIDTINTLTPEELYARLARHMPAEETRQYVGRVLANMSGYPG